jgi:hypothetical protein
VFKGQVAARPGVRPSEAPPPKFRARAKTLRSKLRAAEGEAEQKQLRTHLFPQCPQVFYPAWPDRPLGCPSAVLFCVAVLVGRGRNKGIPSKVLGLFSSGAADLPTDTRQQRLSSRGTLTPLSSSGRFSPHPRRPTGGRPSEDVARPWVEQTFPTNGPRLFLTPPGGSPRTPLLRQLLFLRFYPIYTPKTQFRSAGSRQPTQNKGKINSETLRARLSVNYSKQTAYGRTVELFRTAQDVPVTHAPTLQ